MFVSVRAFSQYTQWMVVSRSLIASIHDLPVSHGSPPAQHTDLV